MKGAYDRRTLKAPGEFAKGNYRDTGNPRYTASY